MEKTAIVYETGRLFTREMTNADLPDLSEILQDPLTMYAYEHAFDDEETRRWLEKQIDNYKRYGHGLWAVVLKQTGAMIGQCGLTWQDFGPRRVLEIGYLFKRSFWRQGYAIEAACGCREYAFDSGLADEVFSIVRDTNIASMNVAIGNGMTVRGRFVKHYHGLDMPHYAFSVRKA